MINKRTVALAKMANVNERESAQTIHTHLQKRLCLGGYMSHHADEEFGCFFQWKMSNSVSQLQRVTDVSEPIGKLVIPCQYKPQASTGRLSPSPRIGRRS